MIVIAAILLGALLGDARARRAGGTTRDRLQYAAAHAIALALPALILTVMLDRTLRGG